jgi:hypothetical protein
MFVCVCSLRRRRRGKVEVDGGERADVGELIRVKLP